MANLLKQSSAAQALVFLMVQSSDHITPLTGATCTVKISKNGAAGAALAGAVSEIDSTTVPGWYKVAGNATDTNTLGPLILHASATSGDPTDILYEVVAFDPQDAVRQGMTALPSVAAGAAGGLATATNASGQVVASNVLADVATALTAAGLILARMQLLDAAACTATIAGNVETMHTLDGAHVFTATYDNISNPTSVTVAQVS